MSQLQPTAQDDFLEELHRIRLRLDLLPAEQQPHLFALADTIDSQHRRLNKGKLQANDTD
ncbi:MAG TPA: hypothetical protein EYP56_00890 [Planctomycetaceae bacterium]|nr:hypothetical protein [Planctomycetaceae bacterium]